jgi:hypothetical protein
MSSAALGKERGEGSGGGALTTVWMDLIGFMSRSSLSYLPVPNSWGPKFFFMTARMPSYEESSPLTRLSGGFWRTAKMGYTN